MITSPGFSGSQASEMGIAAGTFFSLSLAASSKNGQTLSLCVRQDVRRPALLIPWF
jgi:hypothetical protein